MSVACGKCVQITVTTVKNMCACGFVVAAGWSVHGERFGYCRTPVWKYDPKFNAFEHHGTFLVDKRCNVLIAFYFSTYHFLQRFDTFGWVTGKGVWPVENVASSVLRNTYGGHDLTRGNLMRNSSVKQKTEAVCKR